MVRGIKKTTEEYKKDLEEINKKNGTNIRLKDGVEYVGDGNKTVHMCTCGKEWNVTPTSIIGGLSKSCGICYTFEQWCIDNNRQDILNRWDHDLNDLKPNEITYGTNKKYYFKCPRGIHNSELKKIKDIIHEKNIKCNQCNSFAQWGIDNLGKEFLEKYWDLGKNKNINPWEILKNSKKKVFIKCQEKDYHFSYSVMCNSFVNGNRCSYCNHNGNNIHPLDSLGKLLEDKGLLHLWSDKNKRSPYKYPPSSHQEVYWKCPEGKHNDFKRNINNSNTYDFRCPECQYSKGEKRINDYLINNGYIKINQNKFEQLVDEDKYNKNYYITQKEFDNLLGINNGLLSYDFYIHKYSLLIEYQGEQHEKYIPGFHSSKKKFEKQVEHDKRKREYALNHNINLLEIWYWDFDRIEEILDKAMITYKNK